MPRRLVSIGTRSIEAATKRYAYFALVGLSTLLLCACATQLQRVENPPGQRRPNIIFIMADDHTVQAMSCYDSIINQTPNLDRIAREGMRFDRAYCTNSICAPSRAVLLTGKYSHRNGHVDNRTAFDGTQTTFPKLLQKAGYETALVGKWHLISEPTGFDYWSVLPGQGDYYNPDFIRMGERERVSGYVTDLITDEALAWLKQRAAGQPFCLLLHHKAPHRNWMPGPEHLDLFDGTDLPIPDNFFDDYATRSAAAKTQEMTISEHLYAASDLKIESPAPAGVDERIWGRIVSRMSDEQIAAWRAAYGPKNAAFRAARLGDEATARWKYQRYIKDYLRCVQSVDDNVGRVLDYLDESGLADDTIVVYTSDQGFFLGEHGWYDKRFMYQETHGIPLVVRYPREVSPGAVNDDFTLNLDFASTFLDYAGVDIPEDLQGKSLRPLLRGESPDDWRDSIYYHYYEYPGSHAVKRHYGVRTARYLLIHFYYDIDAWELYDTERDPAEMNNLYADPAYSDVVAELKGELERLRSQFGDSDESEFMPQPDLRIEHGAVGCPVSLRHPYAAKYAASGPGGLTDGVRGADRLALQDFAPWQGFHGVDLHATVDLGSATTIRSVSTGFLQDVRSWIFLPTEMRVSTSVDGTTFKVLGSVSHDISARKGGGFRKELSVASRSERRARYVRVEARSLGKCPEWHRGAGSKAWVFADEIAIR